MSTQHSPAPSLTAYDISAPSDDGSWNFLDIPGSASQADASSVTFLSSPESGSMVSYGIVVHNGQAHRGPSLSPMHNQSPELIQLQLPPTSSPVQAEVGRRGTGYSTSTSARNSLSASFLDQAAQSASAPSPMSNAAAIQYAIANSLRQQQQQQQQQQRQQQRHQQQQQQLEFQNAMLDDQQWQALSGFLSEALPQSDAALASALSQTAQQRQLQALQQASFSIQDNLQSAADVPPWDPTSIPETQESQMFTMDSFGLGPPSPVSSFAIATGSSNMSQSASPRSPANEIGTQEQPQLLNALQLFQLRQWQQQQELLQFQQFQLSQQPQQPQQPQQMQQMQPSQFTALNSPAELTDSSFAINFVPAASTTAAPVNSPAGALSKSMPSRPAPSSSINKVRGPGVKVTKKKAASASSASSASDQSQLSSSHGSSSASDNFVIFTPKTIRTHTGTGSRFNPFECFDAMSATQKGRKGPLAEEVKESALRVRRAGACFCCHSRKVRCDAQLPCKNCIKLTQHLPHAMCWRFDDFLGPLFPTVIREHLTKGAVDAFVADNVASFKPNSSYTVSLKCGPAFKHALEIRNVLIAEPKPSTLILKHARLAVTADDIRLSAENSLPVGLDLSEASTVSASLQLERLKKSWRTFVESTMNEENFVATVTANHYHNELPRKLLTIIRNFYLKTKAPIVKQALTIYTMQYIMSHHLTFTRESMQQLPFDGEFRSHTQFQTSRLLNRQIKAVLDTVMKEEVDKLFKMFARELKPKMRTAWGTCLSAFLVFCLFMETTGLALDYFCLTENQVDLENCRPLSKEHSRQEAVKLNREMENLPFRQFAYQFHNIYQTHPMATPEASPSSSGALNAGATSTIRSAFNPLRSDAPLKADDLDKPTLELVMQLRGFFEGDSWSEMDFVSYDPLLDEVDPYPYPRDVAVNYTGRLCSKFLLSFFREDYIYTPA